MISKQFVSAFIFALSFSLVSIAASATAQAAELVMYFSEDCEYSAIFDIEVAPNYPDSAVGRAALLKRIAIEDMDNTEVVLKDPVTVTPTFVLVQNGRELGRITGYPGRKHFATLVNHLVKHNRE